MVEVCWGAVGRCTCLISRREKLITTPKLFDPCLYVDMILETAAAWGNKILAKTDSVQVRKSMGVWWHCRAALKCLHMTFCWINVSIYLFNPQK
jgi:hypothetical protein